MFDILMVFLIFFSKKFEKNQQMTKNHVKLFSMQKFKSILMDSSIQIVSIKFRWSGSIRLKHNKVFLSREIFILANIADLDEMPLSAVSYLDLHSLLMYRITLHAG